ncbi:PIN domain-containing protein [Escherichia coli]|uniref:PIN domain-containing protein n=1 Tax=Escherichia coli TaxID=562 RepID=UPI0032C10F4F
MPLQTRNVFIDTEFFVKAGLEFSSRTLESFKNICADGHLRHITTSIVAREVKGKISDSIQESIKSVTNFRRKAKILTSSNKPEIQSLFVALDAEEIEQHAIELYDDFLSDSDSTILELESVSVDKIMNMYFNCLPPFQEGKKKHEFPDAFTLLAIENHLPEGECIYVVSEDSDLIEFCKVTPQFIAVDSLSKILDIYNSHDQERASFIKQYVAEHIEEIKDSIREDIEDADVYNASSWEDAEVDELTVDHIHDFEPSIIQIDDESCLLSFNVDVDYTVSVTGPDFNNGIYDKEDGRTYTFGSTSREDTGTINVFVEVELPMEIVDTQFVVQDRYVSVSGLTGGIEVCVEENGYEDY